MADCNECSDATTCTLCDPGATNKNIKVDDSGCVSDTGCGAGNYANTAGASCETC